MPHIIELIEGEAKQLIFTDDEIELLFFLIGAMPEGVEKKLLGIDRYEEFQKRLGGTNFLYKFWIDIQSFHDQMR